jgi:hypothetical protein
MKAEQRSVKLPTAWPDLHPAQRFRMRSKPERLL